MTSSKEQEQKERKALLGSSTDATSYRDLANLDNSLSGRFAIVPGAEPSVSGRKPFVEYPAAAPPWSGPQVGVEQPLGWSVEDQEPCGTHAEVEQSLRNAAPEVPFPYSCATAPPSPINQPLEERGGGGEFSRVASTIPKVDASRAGGRLHSRKVSFPSATVETHPAFSSGNISREDLAELLGRLIVPKEK
jgi:hypothetical protein